MMSLYGTCLKSMFSIYLSIRYQSSPFHYAHAELLDTAGHQFKCVPPYQISAMTIIRFFASLTRVYLSIYYSARPSIKFDAFDGIGVKITTLVRAALFLVLLFREAFALGDAQVGICAIRVIVRNVSVGGKARVNLLIRRYTTEWYSTWPILLAAAVGGDRR
jgi:hypothetical protein